MRGAVLRGLGFGLTSGVITTLGMMIGLASAAHSKLAVVGGILTVAVADAFSDALGMEVSTESDKRSGKKAVFQAGIATFLSKFVIALSFVVAVLLLPLNSALVVNVVWAVILLSSLSILIARVRGDSPRRAVLVNLLSAFVVMVITHFLGKLINYYFS